MKHRQLQRGLLGNIYMYDHSDGIPGQKSITGRRPREGQGPNALFHRMSLVSAEYLSTERGFEMRLI